MAKVSIIIPVYNVEKYLRKCLDSVINQTLKDIEIICVNDGSTDGSPDILNEYAQKDSRIKVINKENGGLSSARNAGLDIITGEYVYFLDSDDYIELTLFETAINILDNNAIDYFCFSSNPFLDTNSMQPIQSFDGITNYLKIKQSGLLELNFDIMQNTNIQVWNKIFKTSIINKYNIRFLDGLLYEDIYFMWFYFFVSQKAYFDTGVYHHYRLRDNSIMEITLKNKTIKGGLDHLYNWHALFISCCQNSELIELYFNEIIELLLFYTNKALEMVPKKDKKKILSISKQYKKEIIAKFPQKEIAINFLKKEVAEILDNLFSVKNSLDKKHKVICILGIKISILRKNMLPKFSIIVTSYNYEQYIRKTLNSIANQTYKNYEVIIVDDGSKDNSLDIIREFTDTYNNFHLYQHPDNQNKGLVESFKLGISKCTGEYVAFLESDDYWADNKLELISNKISNNKGKINFITHKLIPIGNKELFDCVYYANDIMTSNINKRNKFELIYKENLILTFSGVTIKTKILKKANMNTPIKAWLDWWLWRQLALDNDVLYIDEPLTYWRRHNESYIAKTESNNKLSRKIFLKKSNRLLFKQHPLKMIRFLLARFVKKSIKKIKEMNTK